MQEAFTCKQESRIRKKAILVVLQDSQIREAGNKPLSQRDSVTAGGAQERAIMCRNCTTWCGEVQCGVGRQGCNESLSAISTPLESCVVCRVVILRGRGDPLAGLGPCAKALRSPGCRFLITFSSWKTHNPAGQKRHLDVAGQKFPRDNFRLSIVSQLPSQRR